MMATFFTKYRVLDSACGSGNFLYIAFRELRRLEWDLAGRLGDKARAQALSESDEKGQAQVFCDRLFQAFGHAGVFESGGEME